MNNAPQARFFYVLLLVWSIFALYSEERLKRDRTVTNCKPSHLGIHPAPFRPDYDFTPLRSAPTTASPRPVPFRLFFLKNRPVPPRSAGPRGVTRPVYTSTVR